MKRLLLSIITLASLAMSPVYAETLNNDLQSYTVVFPEYFDYNPVNITVDNIDEVVSFQWGKDATEGTTLFLDDGYTHVVRRYPEKIDFDCLVIDLPYIHMLTRNNEFILDLEKLTPFSSGWINVGTLLTK